MRRAQTGTKTSGFQRGANGVPLQLDPVLESENDRLTDELKGKITSLKSLTIEIGGEVRAHNHLLSEMDDDFDGAGGFLRKVMSRVQGVGKGSHNYVTLYLIIFSFVVFLFLWIFILRR